MAKLWWVTVFILVTLLPVACTTATKTSSPTDSTPDTETKGPFLSNELKHGFSTYTSGDFNNVGLAEKSIAVDFSLKDTLGNTVNLAQLLREKPVVMILGSFT